MSEKISILGCGWLGSVLATDLHKKGFKVKGSTTTQIKTNDLRASGIDPFVIDICSIQSNLESFLDSEVLVIAITSKNIESFRTLIEKIEASPIKKVVFVSSTSVYPNTNAVITEDSNTKDTSLAAIEKLFIDNSVFKCTIVRFGGLYGYDRKPGNFIKGKKSISNPEGYINFIHRDDCIEILKRIIEKNVWNEVLNACSDDHPKRREFYLREAKKVGQSSISFDENSRNDFKIIDSQKLKRLLDYQFRYSDLFN